MNTPYQCEIILTNISNQPKTVNLLFQIPNGAIPLKRTKYIESKQMRIPSFHTEKQLMQFYFPMDGVFQHAQSNISLDSVVIAKSELETLEVGRKRIISKVENF